MVALRSSGNTQPISPLAMSSLSTLNYAGLQLHSQLNHLAHQQTLGPEFLHPPFPNPSAPRMASPHLALSLPRSPNQPSWTHVCPTSLHLQVVDTPHVAVPLHSNS